MATKRTKREEILTAAETLFTTKGFSGVSMDDIAARAPVSKPTLYSNFKDKGALFSAVIERKCACFLDLVEMQMGPEEEPETALRRVGEIYLGKIVSPQPMAMARVIISASGDFPAVARTFFVSGPSRMQDMIAEYLKAQHKRKKLKVPDPAAAAEMFMGLLKGNIHFRLLLGVGPWPDKKELRYAVTYAVKIFLAAHVFPKTKTPG